MGLSRPTIRLLARALAPKRRSGSVVTFGKSGIEGQYEQIREILIQEGITPAALEAAQIEHDSLTQFGRSLHQDTLFRMLGFSVVHSLDYFDAEQPTFQVDLNQPIPDTLRGRYDLLMDAGTTEHCFDVRQVLANAVAVLKPGGYACHLLPMTGWINHGFYSFSPTLLLDFYAANGFDELELKIVFSRGFSGRTYCLDYAPADARLYANFPGPALLFFLGRKATVLPETVIPLQGAHASQRPTTEPIGSSPRLRGLAQHLVRALGPEGASVTGLRALGLLRRFRLGRPRRLRR
jgi:SAM-dependent methyltransferase